MCYESFPFYIMVQDVNDIVKKSDNKLDFMVLLKEVKVPEKIISDPKIPSKQNIILTALLQ